MALKHSIRPHVHVRGFYDTLMSNEMPEVWAVVYILAMATLVVFLLTG